MRVALIVVFVLLFAVPANAQDTSTTLSMGALIAAAVADLWTTELALNHGGSEANPVMRNKTVRLVVKPLLTTALVVQSYRYARRGERLLAILTALIPAAIWTAATINNAIYIGRTR